MEKKKKVVVAYSGGLDTSYTVMYLAKEKGYEVYAACANTGGFSAEQLKANEENAYRLGATKYVTLDVTREYYAKSLKYMIFGNVLRNGTYPISVSSERIFQALAIARYANEIGADAIAHGSTGAGNDQVRFDMTFLVMAPDMEIITLTRDRALSRDEEIEYLRSNGFTADFAKMKYSYNVGIWGTSICGGEILDSKQGLPESAYLKQVEKTGKEELRIEFKQGEIAAVNGEPFDDKIQAIRRIEETATPRRYGNLSSSFRRRIWVISPHRLILSIAPDLFFVLIAFVGGNHHTHFHALRSPYGLHHVDGSHHVGLVCFDRYLIAQPHQGLGRQMEYNFRLILLKDFLHLLPVPDIGTDISLYFTSYTGKHKIVTV